MTPCDRCRRAGKQKCGCWRRRSPLVRAHLKRQAAKGGRAAGWNRHIEAIRRWREMVKGLTPAEAWRRVYRQGYTAGLATGNRAGYSKGWDACLEAMERADSPHERHSGRSDLEPAAPSTVSHAVIGGNAADGDVEIRYDPPNKRNESLIDEVVAHDALVHLERMDTGQWALIIYAKKEHACFMINGKDVCRSPVTTRLFWLDPVGSGNQVTSAERSDSPHRSEAP